MACLNCTESAPTSLLPLFLQPPIATSAIDEDDTGAEVTDDLMQLFAAGGSSLFEAAWIRRNVKMRVCVRPLGSKTKPCDPL